ncbi:MAG: B12-binding domain-containing radical SAM protein, partial [Bacteroidota bacterium]
LLKRLYRSEHPPSLEGVRYDRSLFRGKRYAPIKPVQFGRGCKFSCDFCSIHAFYGKSIRQRPVPEVIEEIRALGSKSLFFVDDNLFADETRIRELLEALVALKVKWGCQISIDVTEDSSLLRLMRRSGCQCVQIGFESLDARNLGLMKKAVNLQQGDYRRALSRLREHGIMVYGTFVLGYDHDAPESIPATVDFALKHRFFLANFNPLMTMPGTPLYRRLREEGRLLFDQWWTDPRFRYGQAMLRPKGMTPEQLTEGCLRARLRFNQVSSLFLRALDPPNRRDLGRVGLFWAANWISRKEILAKQGISLG